MKLPDSLSAGYARNLLFVVHKMLREAGPTETHKLQNELLARNWKAQSLSALKELLEQADKWFSASPDGWLALESDFPVAVELYVETKTHAAAPKKRIYESRGGEVWHRNLYCTLLWDGKKKAQEEGRTIQPVDERETSNRRPCMGCGHSHGWSTASAPGDPWEQ